MFGFREYWYVPYTDDVSIPVPADATPGEAAVIIAHFIMANPPEKLAAEVKEWKQILRDFEEGKLIIARELLAQMKRDLDDGIQPDHVVEPPE